MEHNHNHSHEKLDYNKTFAFAIILNVIYIIVEFVFGLRINSMALIADAGHNLSDVLGLLLAWGATYLARTLTTTTRTYGLRKSTILAAFFNAIILLIAVGAITIEAVRKFISPEPVQGTTMMVVAGIGIVINTLTALLFLKGKENDINIKGAFLHMAADAGISLGVVMAGLIITYTNWLWLDPAISLLIVFVITIGTWGLLKDSFMLSMDAVPDKINVPKVKQYLTSLPTVKDLHDLHIWGMSTTETALTAHLVVEKFPANNQLVETINSKLHDEFGIEHPTIQLELTSETNNCEKCG
ncbi:MAG: cation diffusion facilitator family transporter [Stygiobacter sp.]|nr:MAG: cation diffusion facilitator family transporter [Stygiobacter sp.]KAF0217981.1 MAG: cation diffusion facilitator family [Ignavibacteria bacterium]